MTEIKPDISTIPQCAEAGPDSIDSMTMTPHGIADSSSAPTDSDREVFAEQVKFLYRQLRPALFGSLLAAILVVVVLWGQTPRQPLLIWSGLLIGVTIARFYILRRFNLVSPQTESMARWRYYFILGAAGAGFIWGMAGPLLIPPESITYQVLLVLVLAGVLTGASQSLSATITPFVTFSVPAMIFTTAWLFQLGDLIHRAMGLLLVLFSITLLFFTRYFNRTLVESFQLRFSNAGLVRKLENEAGKREMVSSITIEQNRILEMLVRQQPMEAVLDAINHMVELQCPGALSSILILDDSRQHLLTASAPGLPDAYSEAINGGVIGPKAGSCGTAAYRNEMVIVEDIASDPLWEDYRDLALSHGLQACWSMPIQDNKGEVMGTFALYHDKQVRPNSTEIEIIQSASNLAGIAIEHKRADDQLHRLAHEDMLTLLPNRALFMDRLERAIAQSRRKKKEFALLFIDLDRFKAINDTLGHEAGDRVLVVVAGRLKGCVRRMDTVARLGGDEFTVILTDIHSTRDVVSVAEKILDALSRPLDLDGDKYYVGGSIGISIYPDDGSDVDTLIRNADAAMYRTKNEGREGYQFFTLNVSAQSSEKLDIEKGLRRAMEGHELSLYYQPVIDLRDSNIASLETLLRWRHPEKGLLAAKEFIHQAEESKLILPIDEYVLRNACQQHRLWQKANLATFPICVHMTINISSMQLRNKNLPMVVREILQDAGIEPGQLGLELTEGTTQKYQKEKIDMLNELKALGVKIIIDDFGTGVSSINLLKNFPVDSIKIDRSLIRLLPENKQEVDIIMAIVDIAHAMNIRVIAKGVETREQLEFLRLHGFDEAQGYLFSQPLPLEEITALLSKHQEQPFGPSGYPGVTRL